MKKTKITIFSVLTALMLLTPFHTVDARPGNAGRYTPTRVTPARVTPVRTNTTPTRTIVPIPIPINRNNSTNNTSTTTQSDTPNVSDVIGTTRFLNTENQPIGNEVTNEKLVKAPKTIKIEDGTEFVYKETRTISETEIEHIYKEKQSLNAASIFTFIIGGLTTLLFASTPVLIILIVLLVNKRTAREQWEIAKKHGEDTIENNIVQQLQETDPNFSVEEFESHVKKAYMVLVNAWTNIDMTRAHQFVTPTYADTLTGQLQEFINNKTKNINQGVEFNNVLIDKYTVTDQSEVLRTIVTITDVDYIVDKDNNIIEGDTSPKTVRLVITFKRAKGAQTKELQTHTHCKHCHAPLRLDISGKCAYCDTLHEIDADQWLIDDIQVY